VAATRDFFFKLRQLTSQTREDSIIAGMRRTIVSYAYRTVFVDLRRSRTDDGVSSADTRCFNWFTPPALPISASAMTSYVVPVQPFHGTPTKYFFDQSNTGFPNLQRLTNEIEVKPTTVTPYAKVRA